MMMPVISGTGALLMPSVEELGELARKVSPRERFLQLCPSFEVSLPFPRFPLLPAPLRRKVSLPFASPGPQRDPPS